MLLLSCERLALIEVLQNSDESLASKVSTFLATDRSVVDSLQPEVLGLIAVQAQNFETLKNQKLLDDITYSKHTLI